MIFSLASRDELAYIYAMNRISAHITMISSHLLSLAIGGIVAYGVIFLLQRQGIKSANIADIVTNNTSETLALCYGYDTDGIFGIFGTSTYIFGSGTSMRAIVRYDDIYTGTIQVQNDAGLVQ